MKTWSRVFSSAVFRLIVIVLAVVIPLNLLTLILGHRIITEVERQISLETRNAMELYVSQIDDAMLRMNTELYQLTREDEDFVRLNVKSVTDRDEYYRQMESVVRLGITLNDLLEDNNLIDGVFSYFPEKDYFIQGVGKYGNSMKEQVLAGIAAGESEDADRWRFVSVDGSAFLLFVSQYRNAYCGAWIDLADLADTLGFYENEDVALQAFTDGDGRVYQSNDPGIESLDIDADSQRFNGENYTLVKAESACSDLCYVQVISKSQMNDSLPSVIRVLYVLSIVALGIIPVIIFAMRDWIVRPVGKLVNAMERIEQGDVEFRIEQGRAGTEFDRINRHFNRMMDEVSELKINVYEEQLKSQSIKLDFLSQQIQPHFILNALNILYSYEKEEHELGQKMILCLSKYFRYVVNARADYVELREELEHIRNYFEIQQARFLKTFRATVICDEAVEHCLVPPLLVQNFTENAIKHSLIPGEVVSIVVEACMTEDDRVHICVYDTGCGIPEDVLERIEEFRRTREFRMDLGVGIQNSIDRMEILYQGNASLDISRIDPQGTRIDIVLPMIRKEPGSDECDFDR